MAARRRKNEIRSRQPILAKLWWVSLPVFIAAQGWISDTPIAKDCSPQQFWPIDEDVQSFKYQPLNEILNEASLQILPEIDGFSLVQGAYEPPQIDWFDKEPITTLRF